MVGSELARKYKEQNGPLGISSVLMRYNKTMKTMEIEL